MPQTTLTDITLRALKTPRAARLNIGTRRSPVSASASRMAAQDLHAPVRHSAPTGDDRPLSHHFSLRRTHQAKRILAERTLGRHRQEHGLG